MTHEVAGYYDAGPIDLAEGVRRDMVLSLEEAGFAVESTHHGLTAGQHSFVLPARRGIEAAGLFTNVQGGGQTDCETPWSACRLLCRSQT